MGNVASTALHNVGAVFDPNPEVCHGYEQAITKVYQDMHQPLSFYFISSGHNSYLTGNQLNSKSGVETIIKSLKGGCRVIELDVHASKSGPVCKHGGTATAPVHVKKCLEAIKHHAFGVSPYPVIITLENHLDAGEEVELGKLLRSVLGSELYVPPPSGPGSVGATWLSPHDLQKRFIIRTSKKARENAQELKEVVYIWAEKLQPLSEMVAVDRATSSSVGESSIPKVLEFSSYTKPPADATEVKTDRKQTKAAKQAAKIKQMEAARRAQDPDDEKEDQDADDAEGAPGADAVKKVKRAPVSLKVAYQYTGRHLLRTYPAGWRVGSSNYSPMMAWAVGASFVALNWQEWDKALWLNSGKFSDNGGCGYVLKPEWMRQPCMGEEAAASWSLPSREPRRLAVHIYAAYKRQHAWQRSMLRDDLYVQIKVVGMPQDKQCHKTKAKQDTGEVLINQTVEVGVRFPEMAVLLIELMDEDVGSDLSLCYASLPLATLAEGSYKMALLKSGKGTAKPGQWVKVRFQWLDPPREGDPAAGGVHDKPIMASG